jgi:hypothetical protein
MEQFKTEMKAYFGEPQEGETTKKGKITMIEVGLGEIEGGQLGHLQVLVSFR